MHSEDCPSISAAEEEALKPFKPKCSMSRREGVSQQRLLFRYLRELNEALKNYSVRMRCDLDVLAMLVHVAESARACSHNSS